MYRGVAGGPWPVKLTAVPGRATPLYRGRRRSPGAGAARAARHRKNGGGGPGGPGPRHTVGAWSPRLHFNDEEFL